MRKLLAFGLFLLIAAMSFSQGTTPVPKPQGYVYDGASVLSASQKADLEAMLKAFRDSTSNEIAVFTETSIQGADEQQRSYQIAKAWAVGSDANDNGILIYIATTERAIFIQVGRGLEGAIPDLAAKHVETDVMIPYFKNGDYYGGLVAGIAVMMKAAAGEYTIPLASQDEGGTPAWITIFFTILIIAIVVFFVSRPWRGGGGTYSGRGWYSGGGWSGGGGGWSGGGGGGFGGFGGGSFGGGGAGSRW